VNLGRANKNILFADVNIDEKKTKSDEETNKMKMKENEIQSALMKQMKVGEALNFCFFLRQM